MVGVRTGLVHGRGEEGAQACVFFSAFCLPRTSFCGQSSLPLPHSLHAHWQLTGTMPRCQAWLGTPEFSREASYRA